MALFSERMGLTPAKALQRSEIDSSLRMRIWNVLTIYIWHLYEEDQYGDVGREGRMVDTLARSLWIHYLNRSWTGSRVAIALIVEQSVLRLSIEEAARATMRSNGPIGQSRTLAEGHHSTKPPNGGLLMRERTRLGQNE